VDAVEALDLRQAQVNARGTGDEHFPPSAVLPNNFYAASWASTSSNPSFWASRVK
jgi:hypothetical protein